MALASFEILEVTEMEELVEVTETDAALLRELLVEDESTENKEELYCGEQDTRVKQNGPTAAVSNDVDKHDSLNGADNEDLNVEAFRCYWPDMVGFSPAVDEIMPWYVDDMIGTAEFDCNIDYSGVFFEEETTAYGCLWQD